MCSCVSVYFLFHTFSVCLNISLVANLVAELQFKRRTGKVVRSRVTKKRIIKGKSVQIRSQEEEKSEDERGRSSPGGRVRTCATGV